MSDNIKPPETLEECLILQSHFIGIPKITKKNYVEFYRRGKVLQILGVGFLDNSRMPTIDEIEKYVDQIETPAIKLDRKQFRNVVDRLINDLTNRLMEIEKHLSINESVVHDV
tara:strand:- start:1397 stop:1735 length:339 start_codon:yes stop_codon:yes gene_type:complete